MAVFYFVFCFFGGKRSIIKSPLQKLSQEVAMWAAYKIRSNNFFSSGLLKFLNSCPREFADYAFYLAFLASFNIITRDESTLQFIK